MTSATMSLSQQDPLTAASSLLESVYGPVDAPSFPLPMPLGEAGLCANGKQRRYLWTDAFGVLAYLSLADKCNDADTANQCRQAAHTLIDVVHQCLGTPRSDRPADAMQVDTSTYSPTGFVGLRIGKVDSMPVTDYGMRYDGQYWHYLDKWLLALSRAGRSDEGIRMAKSVFPHFFDAGPRGDGSRGGIRWKLSVDATPPPSLPSAYANDDTLVALIVFSILEAHRTNEQEPSLQSEIEMLKASLHKYRPRVTDDPLGWGLEAIYDQFLQGQPRQQALASLAPSALHQSHLSLPFRLYGALMGARIAGVASTAVVDPLIQLSLDHEAKAMKRGHEEHSTINRVMLAMVLLCPGRLKRLPGDPIIDLSML